MDTNDLPDDLIDTTEAARLLRCHVATVFRWILAGKLPGWRRGRRHFVRRADVVAAWTRPKEQPPKLESRREVRERERWVDEVLKKAGLA